MSTAPGRPQASSHRSPQGEGVPVSTAPGRPQASSHRSPQGEGVPVNLRLVYFMGPSGAGKDSLMHWLSKHPPAGQRLHLARRTVTRPAPDDEATDDATFDRLRRAGALAMHWSANGWHYGVRREYLQPLAEGAWVLVSGSRAHWPTAQSLYPGLTGVHVQASPEVLLQRLLARGRETEVEVQARIERAMALPAPPGVLGICNDGALAEAGEALRQALVAPQAPLGHEAERERSALLIDLAFAPSQSGGRA